MAKRKRYDKEFAWDAAKMEAEGCPAAEPYFRPTYRQGWPL